MRWLLVLLFAASVSVSAHAAEETALPEKIVAEKTTVEKTETPMAAVAENKIPVAAPKGVIDNRKESEIELNLDNSKKSSSESSPVFRLLFSVSILAVIGLGAWVFLKKYTVPQAKKIQTKIKVLQQHFLGPKKSLAIVRVAGESILIGITEQNISMIKSLSLLDDEVPEEAPQHFGQVMADFDEEETTPAPVAKASKKKVFSKELDADEEFAISGIKDIVSKRLKGMRSFE